MFKNLLNITSLVLAIVIVISVITIPAIASVNALTHTASWEASDLPRYFYAWATLTYSGGNGNDVYAYACATTNLGYKSIIRETSPAISASYIGDKQPYQLAIPFVADVESEVFYR